jgi:hypothetical protein
VTASDDDRIAYLAGEGAESLPAQAQADLDELRALLAAPATWADPDPGLEDRVVVAIGAHAGATPRRPPAQRPRRRWRAWPRPVHALAALAAAAVAALVVQLAVPNGGPGPQRFAMVLSGTRLAPRAHGQATLTKTRSGWRIELNATGLPRLDNGRYYQAWLKNKAGVLVPVGTFNNAVRITLWAGVPPTGFPTLTITRQQADGSPASSGKRVLVGTIHTQRRAPRRPSR